MEMVLAPVILHDGPGAITGLGMYVTMASGCAGLSGVASGHTADEIASSAALAGRMCGVELLVFIECDDALGLKFFTPVFQTLPRTVANVVSPLERFCTLS